MSLRRIGSCIILCYIELSLPLVEYIFETPCTVMFHKEKAARRHCWNYDSRTEHITMNFTLNQRIQFDCVEFQYVRLPLPWGFRLKYLG
jgi:hypothetical protein